MISALLSVVALVVAVVAAYVASKPRQRDAPLARDSGGAASGKPIRCEDQALDPRALRDVAIVRYDALAEMSGQFSFSLALLNTAGDGIVLSSINGRAETRTYAKSIVAGESVQELSPEEEEAVHAARMGQGPGGLARPSAKPKITSTTGARGSATPSR